MSLTLGCWRCRVGMPHTVCDKGDASLMTADFNQDIESKQAQDMLYIRPDRVKGIGVESYYVSQTNINKGRI